MYRIIVAVPGKKTLHFRTKKFSISNGESGSEKRVYFTDWIDGLSRDFPYSWCSIEETKEES